MIDLKGLTPSEIEHFCVDELKQKPGQGLRVAVLMFRKRIEDFSAMTDLNRPFRELLEGQCRISLLAAEQSEESADGTRKLLYRLEDGNAVEGVLIPGPDRLTLCVSTQVGCASGCGFCLAGSGGFVRNLKAAEIVNQVFTAERSVNAAVANIVLMGSGEPLGNYDAVKQFVEIATDRHGMGYSGKKVTVSTCGIAPMIERMADDGMAANLAVSLNAATDAVRDQIIPVNRAYPIQRLMRAMKYYCDKTERTVTIEYVMFKGVNDSARDAAGLADLLDGVKCMVNLLMFNPYPGAAFERPHNERVSLFRDILVSRGLVAVVRRSRGRDISAACGQLSAPSPSN